MPSLLGHDRSYIIRFRKKRSVHRERYIESHQSTWVIPIHRGEKSIQERFQLWIHDDIFGYKNGSTFGVLINTCYLSPSQVRTAAPDQSHLSFLTFI